MRTWCEGAIRRLGMLVLLSGLGLAGVSAARAASLDPAMLPKIQAATFEVVQAKPTSDPLTYERPLPLGMGVVTLPVKPCAGRSWCTTPAT